MEGVQAVGSRNFQKWAESWDLMDESPPSAVQGKVPIEDPVAMSLRH